MIETAPYSEWSVDELRDELRERQLLVSGNKSELVERLIASDTAATGSDSEADGDDVGEDEVTDGAGNPVVAGDGDSAAAEPKRAGECVVDDGTPHTGRAVNGVICSAHAMRYRSDGTRRG
jgi:hypothetical protein